MPAISRTTTLLVTTATLAAATSGVAVAHGRTGGRGAAPAQGALVHGLGVVKTSTGYATRAQQYGSVTAVSPTSLTVASGDGYSATYVLNSSTSYGKGQTVESLAVGDVVSVAADVVESTSTATRVDERTPKIAPSPSVAATAAST